MHPLRRLLGYLWPHSGLVAASLAFASISTFVTLLPPWMMSRVIDEVPHPERGRIALYILLFGVASVGATVVGALDRFLQQWLGQLVVRDLRNALHDHLQSQSMSFYDQWQAGQLMSRVMSDVGEIEGFAGSTGPQIVSIVLMFVIYGAALLALSWPLTLVVAATVPLGVLVMSRQGRVLPVNRAVQQRVAQMTVVAHESVTGIKTVKAFGQEGREAARLDEMNDAWLSGRRQSIEIMNFVTPALEALSYIVYALVLVAGALLVMNGLLTVGVLLAFLTYVLALWAPVRNGTVSATRSLLQQATASAERVFEILDIPSAVAERPGAVDPGLLRGEVEFEGVSFGYGRGAPLINQISFKVAPGEVLAIVGASGSGKTTVASLIPRFYDVSRGTVRIDGLDVRDLRLSALRSQTSVVLQDTFLFNTSVRANISYGRPDASLVAVEGAARAADAHEFIASLPDGYDTVIGERGVLLSGGQRQRIALARALLVDPRILILDEATSSVDALTAAAIERALKVLMVGRTTIVIAHRLATVQRANRVIVLERGELVGVGTHESLLRDCPAYAYLREAELSTADTVASTR